MNLGDRVVAFCGIGAFAEQVVLEEGSLVSLPKSLDYDTAATLGGAYGTSYYALIERAQLKAGETLLVLGAAGGVGLAAVEIGKALGARVIAAASSNEKLHICKEHGADALINYKTQDLRQTIREYAGSDGPNVIYDPVGGDLAEPAFRSIAWGGRYLVVGFASGRIPTFALNLPLLKGASVVGVFWGEYLNRVPDANQQTLRQLMQWFEVGKIRPHIAQRFDLQSTGIAIDQLKARIT